MQPRTRVLAVTQSAELGGAELALQRIAERLPAHGIDVEIEHLPIGSVQQGGWPRALVSWPRARRLAGDFDAVLLNGIATHRLAPAMRGTTLAPYVHELVDSAPRAWRSQRFWRSAPVVLAACNAVAERCKALGAPPDRVRTVYAPVEAVEPAPQPEWADGPVVGFVGRIAPHKRTLELARALRGVEARLVIVGDGSGDYREAVRSAAPDAVFVGQVDDARSLMRWFTVLAVPSQREAFGTVAAEALAAGTPVVATRGTGMEEYVEPGTNGELVMPGDVDALRDAIRRLLPQAAAMESAARESVRRFSTDRVTGDVASAIRAAIGARR